jgi:hypothetical protein
MAFYGGRRLSVATFARKTKMEASRPGRDRFRPPLRKFKNLSGARTFAKALRRLRRGGRGRTNVAMHLASMNG